MAIRGGCQQPRMTVWLGAGPTLRGADIMFEKVMCAGRPLNGERPTNTYCNLEYACTRFGQLMILDAIITMLTDSKLPVWQSSNAHVSTTATPIAVATGFPHADQAKAGHQRLLVPTSLALPYKRSDR